MFISDIIGSSPLFRSVLDQVNLVAPANCSVLLRGETGTGKEVIAQAIHQASSRHAKVFVPLNCAAIPAGLVGAELFGHERGAFTGALTRTKGRFETADGGTLFLDEIGDLPLELQPTLLRVLQEQEFERLGGRETLRVNVRVIAATNQDLWGMVQERKFRADLFYRLNVFPITLPPLRDRIEDLPLFVTHFVKEFACRQAKSIHNIPSEVFDVLANHTWPGNVRELQNVIERAVILSTGSTLRLPQGILTERTLSAPSSTSRTLAEAERDHIVAVLGKVGGVVGGKSGAAARLGLPRTTLLSRMQKLGISSRRAYSQAGSDSTLASADSRFETGKDSSYPAIDPHHDFDLMSSHPVFVS